MTESSDWQPSEIQISLIEARGQGIAPCKKIEELIAEYNDRLEGNPQDASAHALKREAQIYKEIWCG